MEAELLTGPRAAGNECFKPFRHAVLTFKKYFLSTLQRSVRNNLDYVYLSTSFASMARPRKRSNLGADLRGDTGAPAISTFEPNSAHSSAPASPPLTPVSHDQCTLDSCVFADIASSAVPLIQHVLRNPTPTSVESAPSSAAGSPSLSGTHGSIPSSSSSLSSLPML